MLGYQSGQICRMRFLQQALDDPSALDCGRCDVCAGAWYPTDVPDGAAAAAGRTLRRVGVEIDARSQWPSGMSRLGVSVSGKLAAEERLETGRAVARLTDLGWGSGCARCCRRQMVRLTSGCSRRASRCLRTGPGSSDPLPSSPYLRCAGRCSWNPWRARSRPSAGSPSSGRSTSPPTRAPASRAATARSGWPPCTRGSECPPSSRPVCGPRRAGAARRRPGRLPVDHHGGGARAALAGAARCLPFALAVAA